MPKAKGMSARWRASNPLQICTSSKPQNSEIIQYELAVIHKVMARLCASSDLNCRVRQAIMMEMASVGKIMAMPSVFQIRHQLTSLRSQKIMCMFSILRYRAGMTYRGSFSLFMLCNWWRLKCTLRAQFCKRAVESFYIPLGRNGKAVNDMLHQLVGKKRRQRGALGTHAV
mgnify:CR=1 FL=1